LSLVYEKSRTRRLNLYFRNQDIFSGRVFTFAPLTKNFSELHIATNMYEVELLPSIKPIHSGVLTAITSPTDFDVERAILDYLNTYRDGLLYVCGNYSLIISRINRLKHQFDVRRAFTAYQLLQILEEAEHRMVFIEHDTTLSEEGMHEGLMEALFLAMKDVARRGSIVVFYSARVDLFTEYVAKNADRYIQIKETKEGCIIRDSSTYPTVYYYRTVYKPLPSWQTTLLVFG